MTRSSKLSDLVSSLEAAFGELGKGDDSTEGKRLAKLLGLILVVYFKCPISFLYDTYYFPFTVCRPAQVRRGLGEGHGNVDRRV